VFILIAGTDLYLTDNMEQSGVLHVKGISGDVTELIVSNLPVYNSNGNNHIQIRARLTRLGSNCRGRVVRITHDGRALLRFPNREAMLRSVGVMFRDWKYLLWVLENSLEVTLTTSVTFPSALISRL